jgi:NAD(P)-dependent dehydrogenase (short-subunit alcohol dehydrogenase family)
LQVISLFNLVIKKLVLMSYSLENKVIVVTGGAGLLGSDMVKKFIKEKAIVISLDINELEINGVENYTCDLTDQYQVDIVFDGILKKFNKIDGLVNNAYPRTKDWGIPWGQIELDSWRKNVDMQLNSLFYITQKFSNASIERNTFSSIVNIGSIYGIVGNDFSVYEGTNIVSPAAYSAIKGGVANFTRYLASLLAKDRIRVNCVSPGGIENGQDPIFVRNYISKVPMKRMCMASDVSPIVAFLLSDEAAYITGQNIAVDGGWTCI